MKRIAALVFGLSVLAVMSAPGVLGLSQKPPKRLDQALSVALTNRIASTLGPTAQRYTGPTNPGSVAIGEIRTFSKNNSGPVRGVYYQYQVQLPNSVSLDPQIEINEYMSASKATSSLRAAVRAFRKSSKSGANTRVARLGTLAYNRAAVSIPCPPPSPQSTGPSVSTCSYSPPVLWFVQGKYLVQITEYFSYLTPPAPSTALFIPVAKTIANVLAGH